MPEHEIDLQEPHDLPSSSHGRVVGLLLRLHRRWPGARLRLNGPQLEVVEIDRRGAETVVAEGAGPLSYYVGDLLEDPQYAYPDRVRVMCPDGVRFVVPGNYSPETEIDGRCSWESFEEAVAAARSTIERFTYPGSTPTANSIVEDGVVVTYSRACVDLRATCRYAPGGGPSLDSDSVLMRWSVTPDRVILYPAGRGLTVEQERAASLVDVPSATRV